MVSRQDKFFAWLSKKVPSFRMSDYFFVIGELERFARNKSLFRGSLFDVDDPVITGRLVTAVNSDKLFRFTHKKQMKSITDLVQHFHNYTKEQAVGKKAEELSSPSDHTYPVKTMIERNASISGVEVAQKGDSKEEETIIKPGKVVGVSKAEEDIKSSKLETEYTVDFANRSDYAFTRPIYVLYFGKGFHEFSWRDVYVRVCRLLLEDYPDEFVHLRDNDGGGSFVYRLIHDESSLAHLHAPVKIGDGFYVETNCSASDLVRYIKYLLDYCGVDYENLVITYEKSAEKKEHEVPFSEPVQAPIKEVRDAVTPKDPVIVYLEQCGLQYLDYRHKTGCLWVIGGQNIADKMEILQQNGVRMCFKAGGGNVTGGKDAWWTRDTTGKPIEWPDKGLKSTVLPASEEKSSQKCSIQEGRSAFQAWMESGNISKSSARTAVWALTKVSDIAIEQGITVDPLYSICNAKEVAYILARLEENNAFKKYCQQNTVALFAARKYAAFRAGQRDISTTSDSSASQSLTHPGRLEFEQWLKENNCPTGSIRTYADGVERIGKYLLDNGLEDRNIFAIRGIKRLEKIRAHLLTDKVYAEKVHGGNTSLDRYALKKYIAFRKNESSGDVDDVTAERFSTILRDYFENGFRINSMIDRNRFKQFYMDTYGETLSQTDNEIIEILKQIGNIQDDRIFLHENSSENDLLDDIQAEIAKAFADGISCVYLSEVFSLHQDKLATQLHIFSTDVLKELLLSTSYCAYRASKHYFYLGNKTPDVSEDIRRLMQRSNVPLSYKEIYEKLRFIPLDTIKHSLVVTDKIVNVAQETYFYAPNLPVSADELNQIAKLIQGQLQQKSFITDIELRKLIEKYCPSVSINTADFLTWGLRNALAVLLEDRFSFNGAIISERGKEINMSQAFAEFCRCHETMTIDELRQFAKEMNTVIYWEPVYEEMVRTSQREFVLKERVHFDVSATDAVLDELVNGDYQALQNFTLFLHFPVIDVRWNSFVLESYVANYSKDFALLHASYTATDCCGAVIRKASPIRDFKGLVTDVLARSSQWKTKNDALALLVDKGYLQRKRYSEIDTVIMEANYRRASLKNP